MFFLVDAQLPPSLAQALRQSGCLAVHRVELGLLAAADQQIWEEAISRSAVLITKDRDFPVRRAASNDGPAILWIRVGNIGNRKLIDLTSSLFDARLGNCARYQ